MAEAVALIYCVNFCRPLTTFGAPIIFILPPGSAANAASPGATGYHPLKRVLNSALIEPRFESAWGCSEKKPEVNASGFSVMRFDDFLMIDFRVTREDLNRHK